MKLTWRTWRLAGLITFAVVLTAGCNLASVTYFLTTGFQEPMEEPGELKLAVAGREIKVAVLTYAPSKYGDFARVDADLSGLLVRQLQIYCAENKEKVT